MNPNLHSRYLLWQLKRWEYIALFLCVVTLLIVVYFDTKEINQLHEQIHEYQAIQQAGR